LDGEIFQVEILNKIILGTILFISSCNQYGFAPSVDTVAPHSLYHDSYLGEEQPTNPIFNGTSDKYVTQFNLKTAEAFSITTWFKTNSTSQIKLIFWQGINGGNGFGNVISSPNEEMSLSIGNVCQIASGKCMAAQTTDNMVNVIAFHMGDTQAGEDAGVINIVENFTDTSQFHMATVVVKNLLSAPEAELYLDGKFVAKDTGSLARTSRTTWLNNLQLAGPSASARFLDGTITKTMVHSRALSAFEIKTLCWDQKKITNSVCLK